MVERLEDQVISTSTEEISPRFALLGSKFWGGVTDGALSFGFQYLEDLQNPYFTTKQRLGRAAVASTGGILAGYFGTVIGTSLGCGPYAPLCIAGSSLALGAIWGFGLQPMIFEAIPDLQPPPRNLLPLSS